MVNLQAVAMLVQATLVVEGGCSQQWMVGKARQIAAGNAEKLLPVGLDEEQVSTL